MNIPLDSLDPKNVVSIIKMVEDKTISRTTARQLLDAYIMTGAIRKGYASGIKFNDDTEWYPNEKN